MKAVFISFNQAYYEMILAVMDRNNIRGFTYWETVQGMPQNSNKCFEKPIASSES